MMNCEARNIVKLEYITNNDALEDNSITTAEKKPSQKDIIRAKK
jgi:hypothetical protein